MAIPRGAHPSRAKYQPLGDWLAAQPGEHVTLTFAQVEQILGQRLPPSAWTDHAWWWGTERRQESAAWVWLAAGWRLAVVARQDASVTYVRGSLG